MSAGDGSSGYECVVCLKCVTRDDLSTNTNQGGWVCKQCVPKNPRDQYTMRHLDAWLDEQIKGDTHRDKVRDAMLAVYDTDPEYYGAQSWWNVYDRAKCDRIDED